MHFFILSITFFISSCAIQMGKVPIIVKNLDHDEINYDELMKKKSRTQINKDFRKDCVHVFLFIPSRLTLELDTVLTKSCKDSNFSFDNKIYDEFFYFLYGKECIVNEHYCENT